MRKERAMISWVIGVLLIILLVVVVLSIL